MSRSDDREYCAELARIYDYDRYFSAIFAPSEIRASLMALYAFNFELASIRERTSEILIGEIRVQWWRDAVEDIYSGKVRRHAIVSELAAAIERHDLPRNQLDRIVDARTAELCRSTTPDLKGFEQLSADTAGALAGLAVRACGHGTPPPAVEDGGTVWGLTGLLRAMAFDKDWAITMFLPESSGEGENPFVDDRFRNCASGTELLIGSVAERARRLLEDSRAERRGFERRIRPAIGYLAIAELFLRRLGSASHAIDATGLEASRTRRQAAIMKAVVFGGVR